MGTPLQVVKVSRAALVAQLRERDGELCQFPGHEHPLDFSRVDGPSEVTIDHWQPQVFCKANGWTQNEIWSLSNLRLMCKKHNAAKGDRIPNADGTLPPKAESTFKFRRQKRAGRPELCTECDNGHNLFVNEVCANCGCDAQRFPRSAHVSFQECEKSHHSVWWCWVCSITPNMRVGATEMILLGGEGGE